MQANIHQNFSVNTFETKRIEFTSQPCLQSVLIQNEFLLSLQENSTPIILTHKQEIPKKMYSDLIAKYDELLALIKVKTKKIDLEAFQQLKEHLQNPEIEMLKRENRAMEHFGILVGPSIEEEALYLMSLNNKVSNTAKIYVILINQFKTNHNQSFTLSNVILGPKPENYFTNYIFKGSLYGKSKLVHAVVEDYINHNPTCSVSELNKIFPKELHGSLNIVKNLGEIEEKEQISYFIKNPISIKNTQIVVAREWNNKNIKNFIKFATKILDYTISSKS